MIGWVLFKIFFSFHLKFNFEQMLGLHFFSKCFNLALFHFLGFNLRKCEFFFKNSRSSYGFEMEFSIATEWCITLVTSMRQSLPCYNVLQFVFRQQINYLIKIFYFSMIFEKVDFSSGHISTKKLFDQAQTPARHLY